MNDNQSNTPKSYTIFALSDATGDLVHKLALSAVNQFPDYDVIIERIPRIKLASQLEEHFKEAQSQKALVFYSFVSQEMRQEATRLSKFYDVVSIDILGGALDAMTEYFHKIPTAQPGIQYKLTQQYFARTEAVEYTVKHDDGLGLESLQEADIILLGISRTSKTPLSIYLSYQGYRCANIPLVKDIPPPKMILELDRKKMIGLTIDPHKLIHIRATRLIRLGRHHNEEYASIEAIKEEVNSALKLYRELGIPHIDVSNKAIEETASEVISRLKLI